MVLNALNFSNSSAHNGANSSLSLTSKGLNYGFVIIGVVTCIFTATGLLANALTIKVIWKTKSLHSTTNFLLANIAMSDFLTLIFGIPNGLSVVLGGHPTGLVGKYLCVFLTAGNFVGMTTMASILTLCFLAVERYHAIVVPMAQHRRLTKENMKFAFGFIWGASLTISLPKFINTTVNEKSKFCDADWDSSSEILYILISVFLVFVIPSAIIVFCYTAIIKEMYFSIRVDPSPTTQNEDARSKRKLLKILLTVTSLFLVCFGAFSCLWPLHQAKLISVLPYNASVQCLYLQSCFNPIIYAFQSTNYRKALTETLKCCRRRTTRTSQRSTSQAKTTANEVM